MGKSSGGGGGSVGYIQSPEQQQLFNWFSPLAQTTAQYGRQNVPQPLGMRWIDPRTGEWTMPAGFQQPITPTAQPQQPKQPQPISMIPMGAVTPGASIFQTNPEIAKALIATGQAYTNSLVGGRLKGPGAGGTRTSASTSLLSGSTGAAGGSAPGNLPLEYFSPFQPGLWPLPTYQVPSPEFMMPTGRTMGAISPSVWSGIMQPYQKVEQQLLETLGARGGLGSARGGFSGQGAAGLGKYWAEAAPGIGTQAWGMILPALQQGWAAELQKQQALWGEALQQFKYPWQATPSYLSMSMPRPFIQQPSPSPYAGIPSFLGGIGSLLGAFPKIL